eukprot:Partr_v1_DN28666_c1_g1_i13_m49862
MAEELMDTLSHLSGLKKEGNKGKHAVPKHKTQMSSSPSPLIWFQLVDSAAGLPFGGTSATSVLRDYLAVSHPADVVDFLDAVKKKYFDSHLKGIAPSDLRVYENRAAFDRRNSIQDKQEPLEVDSLVDGLGSSMEDAVIVVVPSSNIVYDITMDFSMCYSSSIVKLAILLRVILSSRIFLLRWTGSTQMLRLCHLPSWEHWVLASLRRLLLWALR